MKAENEVVLRLVFSKSQIWALLTAALLLAAAVGIQGDTMTFTTYYPAPYGNYTSLTTKNLKVTGGSPGAGKVLTSDDEGTAAWMDPSAASIPSGVIVLYTTSPCPSGFAEVASLRNRYPIGADLGGTDPEVPNSPGTLGGIRDHSHSFAAGGHSGGATGSAIFGATTQIYPATVFPPFQTVIFCRKM